MKYKIRQKIFSLGDNFVIKNELDEPELIVQSKLLTLGNKLTIYDRFNNELFYVEESILRLLAEYRIYQDGNEVAFVKKKFSLFRPQIDINSQYGNFTIDGDFLAYNFSINQDGIPVAKITKKVFSFTDEYLLDILVNDNVDFLITLVIVVDQILHDRKNSSN